MKPPHYLQTFKTTRIVRAKASGVSISFALTMTIKLKALKPKQTFKTTIIGVFVGVNLRTFNMMGIVKAKEKEADKSVHDAD